MDFVSKKEKVEYKEYRAFSSEIKDLYLRTKENEYVLISTLTPKLLQKYFNKAQLKQKSYWDKIGFFEKLADLLESEAEKRDIVLKDVDSKLFKNERKYRKLRKSQEIGDIPSGETSNTVRQNH